MARVAQKVTKKTVTETLDRLNRINQEVVDAKAILASEVPEVKGNATMQRMAKTIEVNLQDTYDSLSFGIIRMLAKNAVKDHGTLVSFVKANLATLPEK